MEQLTLKNGALCLTEQENLVYQVKEGKVLVFLMPLRDGKTGRRFLLVELGPGETIPSLCWDGGEQGMWIFGLAPLEEAVLESREASSEEREKIYVSFAKLAGVKLFDPGDFPEQMVERYNMNLVKEEVYFYASAREQEATYQKGLNMILGLFRRPTLGQEEESGSRIYDAAAFLCRRLGIPIAPFEVVRDSCGRRFDLKGIARVSHFSVREIRLEPGWYTQDVGPVIAYTKERQAPVICLPKGPGRYIAFNLSTKTKTKVNASYAQTLEDRADMVYRPFPAKKMTLWDLLRFGVRQCYKRDWIASWLLALAGALAGLLIPTAAQLLYDRLLPMGNEAAVYQLGAVVLACILGNLAFTLVKNFTAFRSTASLRYAVQNAVYDRLFRLPENFLERYDSADLAQRAIGITILLEKLSDLYSGCLLSAVFSLFYFIRMYQFSGELTWVAVAMLVPFLAVIAFLGACKLKYESQIAEWDSKGSSMLYQLVSGISKIRIAGVENRAVCEYLEPYTRSKQLRQKKERLTIAAQTVSGATQAVFLMGFALMVAGGGVDLSIGAFVGFTTAFGTASAALMSLAGALLELTEAAPLYRRAKLLLEALPEGEEEGRPSRMMPGTLSGEIEVSNLQFSYAEEEEPVLKGVSFHIKPGEYVGIVGPSGSGKSTLLKLLLGFEEPQNGRIYYDGRDLEGLDKRELRKKFGVVLQDGQLIAGSIYENITIMAPGTPASKVEQVLRDVDLAEDIERMPMGLHTILDEDSQVISGGQRQRILIARAILNKPKILYFDEATSALDNVSQATVCRSLEKLRATRIVVAHRLSTVKNCDRILFLDEGRLVEEGTYEEMMARKGRFYEMAQRQLA
jgi:NHLM bacteriocin system ABC transporter ATP-binding protein